MIPSAMKGFFFKLALKQCSWNLLAIKKIQNYLDEPTLHCLNIGNIMYQTCLPHNTIK